MQKRHDEIDQLEDEDDVATGYRSLGEWDEEDERDEIAAFDDDDDPSRRRDPLRKIG